MQALAAGSRRCQFAAVFTRLLKSLKPACSTCTKGAGRGRNFWRQLAKAKRTWLCPKKPKSSVALVQVKASSSCQKSDCLQQTASAGAALALSLRQRALWLEPGTGRTARDAVWNAFCSAGWGKRRAGGYKHSPPWSGSLVWSDGFGRLCFSKLL